MIKDKELAAHVLAVIDECSARINDTIREVQQRCSDDEFSW